MILPRGEPVEARVRAVVIVVVAPCRNQTAGMAQGWEQVFVQALIPQAAIDGEDGPAPEKGPYTGPILQKEHSHEPSHRGP